MGERIVLYYTIHQGKTRIEDFGERGLLLYQRGFTNAASKSMIYTSMGYA